MADKDNGFEIPINGMPEDNEERNTFGTGEGEEAVGEEEVSLDMEELTTLCRQHVCPECATFQEAEEIRLRALADAENVKKRLQRETEDLKKYVAESILNDLLPVLDNLDLALAHTDGLDDSCKNFVMGVDMTRKAFLDSVKSHGLEPVECAEGMEFNPEFHEAIGTAQEAAHADNTVARIVQNGYVLKGRIIRPAKVMVNKLG